MRLIWLRNYREPMRLYMEGLTVDMGQTLRIYSAPVPTVVRFAPLATILGVGPKGRDVPFASLRTAEKQ
jgi:hypothetical protein